MSAGQNAQFTVAASGGPPLHYVWMRNGAAIAGANSPTYATAARVTDNGAQFSVTVDNAAGSVTSSAVTLTVRADPQNSPRQLSRFLSNSYLGLQIGSISYSFSDAQVQPGFQAQSVTTPHAAVRVTLFGHEFGKYFSVQLTEMRPVQWVVYRNVNGNPIDGSVLMNVGGLTARARLPLSGKWSLTGEGGLGVVTRRGFDVGSTPVVTDVSYATFLYGGGLDYRFNEHWDALAAVTVAPGKSADEQPATVFVAGGVNYTLRRVPAVPARQEADNTPVWPRNMVQFGYATDSVGFGVNDALIKAKVFWPGAVSVASGFGAEYRRNLFHTRRWFALDAGASVSTWESRQNGTRFYTAALYPALRIPLVRSNPAEFYFTYSLAGPAFISRTSIDGKVTGENFTFQDYIGIGTYFGRKRRLTSEVRIQHYSNGNLFPNNPGITIPLGFYLGTSF